MDTLISIVVPIYNVEKYIGKCIESIINQTYKNLEIILVNDGSPDKSPEICKSYAKDDSRIKVINKENGGLSDARNKGLDTATGEYIVFVDGDDYIDKNTIETSFISMIKNNSDIVIWGYFAEYVNQKETIQNLVIHNTQSMVYDKNNFNTMQLNIEKIDLIGYAWNKMYKLNLLKDNKLYFIKGLSLVEDMLFNSEALKYCEKIVFISDPLTHYMQRPRETLGAQFYGNYFDLKIKAIKALSMLLKYWEIENEFIDDIVFNLGFNVIKTNIKKISGNSNFSYKNKILYLDEFIKKDSVRKITENVNCKSLKDKIILIFINQEMKRTLLFVYDKIK